MNFNWMNYVSAWMISHSIFLPASKWNKTKKHTWRNKTKPRFLFNRAAQKWEWKMKSFSFQHFFSEMFFIIFVYPYFLYIICWIGSYHDFRLSKSWQVKWEMIFIRWIKKKTNKVRGLPKVSFCEVRSFSILANW